MEQLSGRDAAFVHQDSRRTPMHISAVLVYDIGKAKENAISLAALRKLARERLADFPLISRKLRRVPMGMDTPYWVDASDADWSVYEMASKEWEDLGRSMLPSVREIPTEGPPEGSVEKALGALKESGLL